MTVSPTVIMRINWAVTFQVAAISGAFSACGARGGGTVPAAVVPSTNCIGACVPDPGSRPPNCAAEQAGLEFFKIWDFESGHGDFMYSYADRSTPNIAPQGFGDSTVAEQVTRCGPTSTWAMNIRGGPFRGWGGGVGIGFNNLWGNRCPDPGCPPVTTEFPEAYATFDLRRWEGISLWARRGPNGQAAIRVGLGDKQTDDDISYLMYRSDKTKTRYCERNRECGCSDQSKTCSFFAGTPGDAMPASATDPGSAPAGFYCWNPGKDPDPKEFPSGAPSPFRDRYGYTTCNITKCDEAYAAYPNAQGPGPNDPTFNDRACTPHSFSGGMGASYCFDPATDPPPYDSNNTCGDHWVFPVALTTDWHLYLIPFTVLQQQGFGKKFARPELAAASMLRLMWDVGWVDYWVDDVGFYRRLRK